MNWPYVMVATIAFGLWALFLSLTTRHLSPMSSQVSYSTLNFILTWTAALGSGLPLKLNPAGAGWITATVICGITGGWCTTVALQGSANPGLVNAVVHSSPVLTLALTWFFLNEHITWTALLGCTLVIGGVVLIGLKGH